MSAPGGAPSPGPRGGSMGPGANANGMSMPSQGSLPGTPVHSAPTPGPSAPPSGAMSQQNLNQIFPLCVIPPKHLMFDHKCSRVVWTSYSQCLPWAQIIHPVQIIENELLDQLRGVVSFLKSPLSMPFYHSASMPHNRRGGKYGNPNRRYHLASTKRPLRTPSDPDEIVDPTLSFSQTSAFDSGIEPSPLYPPNTLAAFDSVNLLSTTRL
ncbi:unnamed protein product [Penicillium bialowiezense]